MHSEAVEFIMLMYWICFEVGFLPKLEQFDKNSTKKRKNRKLSFMIITFYQELSKDLLNFLFFFGF